MFKYIASLTAAAVSVNAVDQKFLDASEALEVQCQAVTTENAAVFDITGLENSSFYSATVGSETLNFNYCAYASADPAQPWYGLSKEGANAIDIADGFIISLISSTKTLNEADGSTSGLTFTQTSTTACPAPSTGTISMTTNVQCDPSNTVAGSAKVINAEKSADGCNYTVTLSHAAGCPKVDLSDEYAWIQQNTWVIGIIYIIAGPIIALFGLQWFPYVTASLVAIFVMGITTSLCLAFGWMNSTVGTIVVLSVAVVLGVVAGILIRRNIWIMVGLLGLVGGFFAGSLTFALISSFSGWQAVWGFWVISSVVAAIGCVLSCYFGKGMVLLSTSFVGSYLFMRSWTLFFPGYYPSEAEIIEADFEIANVGIFWTFIGVFVISFIVSVIFQTKRKEHTHADLDSYQKQH